MLRTTMFLWKPSGLLWANITSPPGWARKAFSRHDSGEGAHIWNFSFIPAARLDWGGLCGLWLSGFITGWLPFLATPHACLAKGSLCWALTVSRFPGSLPPLQSWHSHGMAINYARCVHFQFKCVLIPEEQLMASSYWCEKSLPLQWLWINEIADMEAGAAINCQPPVTWVLNYILHFLSTSPKLFSCRVVW